MKILKTAKYKKEIIAQEDPLVTEFKGAPSQLSILVNKFRILAIQFASNWNNFQSEAEMNLAIEQIQTALEQIMASTLAGRRRMNVPQSTVNQMARTDFNKDPITLQ